MNWGEINVTVQTLRILQEHFREAKIVITSGHELSFINVKASGEALIQSGKTGKFPVLELNITLDFSLKQRVANGSIALTGQILIREFSGKDEMSTRVICDENKVMDGVVGNVAEVLSKLSDEMRSEGVGKVKEWLGGEFIDMILNLA